jgi:lysophospholipase L1-like esterase
MTPGMRKMVVIALPAAAIAAVVSMALVEAWVRLRWDDRRGTPGFYVSDAVLGQRLAPGYRGWFAGVPVEINSLGFRDSREYSVEKPERTFRILVLGDSVTFGHGALSDTTYPYLLEQQLKAWRPDVAWEVWNLGVPGYNTAQELAYLRQVGPRYRPDLVVVGFFENDLTGNDLPEHPSLPRRASSALQRAMQRWFYSYELYKKVALTLRWRLFTQAADRGRLEQLDGEQALLVQPADRSQQPEQRLTDLQPLTDGYVCRHGDGDPDPDRLAARLSAATSEIAAWKRAVGEFQRLHREGAYHVAFFINMAPNQCPAEDRFYPGAALDDEAALRAILGNGTPVGSSVRAFLPYRPSQMPGAGGHSIGNANQVKARALFEFLRRDVLPPLVPPLLADPH